MYCRNCGTKLVKSVNFCGSCGFSVAKYSTSEENTLTPSSEIHSSLSTENIGLSVFIVEARKSAQALMLRGIGIAIVGIIITAIWYSVTEPGGTYFVLWGLVVVGGYQFLRGLYFWIFPQKLLEEAKKDSKEPEKSK